MSNKRKRLGVIGGLGPAATSFFYNRLIKHTQASCDQDHLDVFIWSHATLPDRTESILNGEHEEIIHLLQEDVKMLTALGAENIVIPCNTSHYYYDEIQAVTDVPIIHIIRECVKYGIDQFENVKRVGIMATEGTIKSRIYHRECEALGLVPIEPSEKMQEKVMHLIYNEIKAGKEATESLFEEVVAEFNEKQCDIIILGCTELSVYNELHKTPDNCVDAMKVLVKESIIRSNAVYVP